MSHSSALKQKHISDIIDQPGGSRFSLKVLILVGLAMIFDGYDFMIVSFTMPQISEELSLGLTATGSLASFSMMGMLIGGFFSGLLADRFGRKHVVNICILLYSALTVPVYFIHSYEAFIVCRIFSGIGIGAVIPLSVTLISEYAPSKHRAVYITLTRCFMMFGWVVAGLVALYVVPRFGWRMVYLIGGFPLLYAVVIHFLLPESAQWLIAKKKDDKAIAIANQINQKLDNPAPEYVSGDIQGRTEYKGKGNFAQLFSKTYIRQSLGIFLIALFTCSLSYGLTAWLPTVLTSSGFSIAQSYSGTTLMNAVGILGGAFAGIMADRIGRINSAYLAFGLAALSVIFMALFGFSGLLLPACIFMGFSINYAYISPTPITLEIYPTEIRATGQATVTTVARIGGLLTPILIGGALEQGSTFITVLIIFLIPLAIAVVILRVFIKDETKGKSVEILGTDVEVADKQ